MRSRIAIFEGYGRPFRSLGSSLGRRAYRVPATARAKPYKVKRAKDTKAQKKFGKCARSCAKAKGRKARVGSRKFGSCMRRCMKVGRKSKR